MDFKNRQPSLPQNPIEASMIRRPMRTFWQEFSELISAKEIVVTTVSGMALTVALFPQSWLALVPAAFGYGAWLSTRRHRLAYKVPVTWGGIDYGARSPGGSGYGKANGILYLGVDQISQEELWIENGDARRHGFFLGTTGSGKALPLDTFILTPAGWVPNGTLKPGDLVFHPSGETAKILSVHPQGKVAAVRLWFSDGRHADCCMDHLWQVRASSKDGARLADTYAELGGEGRLMTAGDIGLLHGLQGDKLALEIPRCKPMTGETGGAANAILSHESARQAAVSGFSALAHCPSLLGTPAQRRGFLTAWREAASPLCEIQPNGLRLKDMSLRDATSLKQIAWSLGGTATTILRENNDDMCDVVLMFEHIKDVFPGAQVCRFAEEGLGIIAVERLENHIEMSCIKIDREDGLFVMEKHLVTHNTELLLGVVSQTLMWSSGFLFIDGKGTTEFYARAWTLAKRFGREDDLRVLNFTDAGGDPDAPAGGPDIQSNTLNPFAKGSADQLMNLIVGLMGDAGSGNDMWKNRAMALVTAAMKALVQMRDSGDILLDVQAIRDFLPLGTGFKKELLKRPPRSIEDVPEEAWEEIRTRGGMIELYLRALKGDFSNSSKLALKAFFDTLPGFSMEKAIRGDPQDPKASEQYGFLSMQLTKPLGSLADDYGHIFRTSLGEVDMMDVVINRRILVVLLPALQKSEAEMEMCGKIVVNMMKMLMGKTSGSKLDGSKQEIIDAKQTRSPSPMILVLDEAGYYMVEGIDIMMAQARSLGFMIIVAGQDISRMQKKSPQIAETVAANARLTAVGALEDASKSWDFVSKKFGRAQVAVSSGYTSESGFLGNKWVDRMDASFQEVDRVKIDELQDMSEGEFYFLFQGNLVKSATFYVGDVGKGGFGDSFSVNKFVKVRGPTDRVPNLDQSVEIAFISSYVKSVGAMKAIMGAGLSAEASAPSKDSVGRAARIASDLLWKAGSAAGHPDKIHIAWSAGLIPPALRTASTPALDDEGLEDWDDDLDLDMIASDLKEIEDLDPDDLDHIEPETGGTEVRNPGRRLAGGLSKITQADSTAQRHEGMIDILVAQEAAREKASRISGMKSHIRDIEKEEEESRIRNRKSMGAFFEFVAKNSDRLAQIFTEEDVDGQFGIEILKRTGTSNLIPLDRIDDPDALSRPLTELEKLITSN